MTTLAKIEANQCNAQLSTGPRTEVGKALVARNATRHGIYSNVPVVPGESAEEWEAHRSGVVASLAPVGLLEVNLAERAALLLWRMQRLARYEAESIASAMEEVEVPPLPPPEDSNEALFPPQQKTREDQLGDIRDDLRVARKELAEVVLARDFFCAEPEPGAAVPFVVAQSILEAACGRAEASENLRSDPPDFERAGFLRKLGLTEVDARKVSWTAELIQRGLAVYAGYAREEVEPFTEGVREDLETWAEELDRKVRRLEREEAAVVRLLEGKVTRRQSAKLLPGDGRDERIAKYERHLHSLLTSTLHELERLQARRGGAAVPLPAVTDLNVKVDIGPG